MVDTSATEISAAVFHKHIYISNLTVAPSDTCIAATKNPAVALKGKSPHYLQKYPLAKLTRLSTTFSDVAKVPELEHYPVVPEPEAASPNLTKHVNRNRIMIAVYSLLWETSFNLPILRP
jgi:hypothetical protein